MLDAPARVRRRRAREHNSGGALEKFESSFVFEAEASTPGGLPLRRNPRKLKRPANPVARALLRVDDDDDDRSFAPIETRARRLRRSASPPRARRKPSRHVKEGRAAARALDARRRSPTWVDDDRLALRRPPRLSALPAPPSRPAGPSGLVSSP